MPKVEIPALEDRLHAEQLSIVRNAGRFNTVMCGRRFGKTIFGEQIIPEPALHGFPVGWFAPTYTYLLETMADIEAMLSPLISGFNRTDKRMTLRGGGAIDFWSLDNPDAGRGRAYKRIGIDEAGLVPNLVSIWNQALRPTLTDFSGDAWFFGTPAGAGSDFVALHARGESGVDGWRAHRAATLANPFIDPAEIEAARRELPPEIFAQEFEGIPAPDGGNPFDLRAIAECEASELSDLPTIVYGVDLAKSQDWTVVVGLDENGAVSHLDRWRLDWRATRARLVQLIGDTPALVDETGVGNPIVEDLQAECPGVEGFGFTAPSKQRLMSGLQAAIQSRSVRIFGSWLLAELRAFRYEYSKSGVKYSAPSGLHDDGVCALALAVEHRRVTARSAFTVRVI